MKIIETFKLSTKKFYLFYEFERMWLLLTAINIVAVFLIVRGSTASLIMDNGVMKFLFCTDKTADKTLYNISISYFAAYIFYLIQIYYPEKKKTVNALLSIRSSAHNMILWISRFLFVWDIYAQVDEKEEAIKSAEIKTIYLKDSTGFVYKVDRGTFKNMVKRISEPYYDIISNSIFQSCDYSLRKLFLGKDIAKFIERMHEIIEEAEALDSASGISIGYSKKEIYVLQVKMRYLKELLDMNVDTDFVLTNDKNDIERIEKRKEEFANAIIQNSAFCEVLSRHNEK